MTTFSVTNTLDSGAGSLRQAILDANASSGEDFIDFNLQGSSRKIQPLSPLPFVTESLTIAAGTQPDFDGLPVVQLDGSLIVGASVSGLVLASNSSSISGLHIHSFDYGITILGGSSNVIQNNAIGADPRGNSNTTNRVLGVYLIDATNNIVGADYRTFGNLISGNSQAGVRISGLSSKNQIAGNLIGTNLDGNISYGSQEFGILITEPAFGNIIGSNGDANGDDAERNLISGNSLDGIRISKSNSNIVAGNLIGTSLSGTGRVFGQTNGIVLDLGSSMNIIGTNADDLSDVSEGNVVSGNGALEFGSTKLMTISSLETSWA